MVIVFEGLDGLRSGVGTDLGRSEWFTLEQGDVDAFGVVTGSDDWIHTDPRRAASGPFGAAIVQGDLLLSVVPRRVGDLYEVRGGVIGLVYGSDRVRLPAPVPVGARIRVHAHIAATESKGDGVLARVGARVEVEEHDRPGLTAELLHFYRPC